MLISNQSMLHALVPCSTEFGDGCFDPPAAQPGAKQHARKSSAKSSRFVFSSAG